jgi:hypothetical protein
MSWMILSNNGLGRTPLIPAFKSVLMPRCVPFEPAYPVRTSRSFMTCRSIVRFQVQTCGGRQSLAYVTATTGVTTAADESGVFGP